MTVAVLARALALVLWQSTVPVAAGPKPFFTDDLEGWLKLGGLYLGALGAVIAVMVKLAYNAHTEKVRTLGTDVDGVGKKAETNAQAIAANVAALALLAARTDVLDAKVDVHQRELGEHDAQLKAYERTQHQLQSDIMQAIQSSGEVVRNELHALNIKVARFEERERFGEAMGEIASALRQMAKNQNN